MERNLCRVSGMMLVMIMAFTATAGAEDGCCAHCGCTAQCHKVCRLVCEDRKVEKTCWGCICEDFCVPCAGTPVCKHCEDVCESCGDPDDPKVPFARARKLIWHDWTPNGATMYTKKKLMRKVVTKKVPGYKYVVEDLCDACAAKQEAEAETAPMPAAAPAK